MTRIKQNRQQLVREARLQGLPTEDQLSQNFSKVSRFLEGEIASASTSTLVSTSSGVLASKTALWVMALLLGGGLLGGHVLYHAADSEIVGGQSSGLDPIAERSSEAESLIPSGKPDLPIQLLQPPRVEELAVGAAVEGSVPTIEGEKLAGQSTKTVSDIQEDRELNKKAESDRRLQKASIFPRSESESSQSTGESGKNLRNEIKSARSEKGHLAKKVRSGRVDTLPEKSWEPSTSENSRFEMEAQVESSISELPEASGNPIAKSESIPSDDPSAETNHRDSSKVLKSTLAEEIRLISLARDAKEQGKLRRAKMWLRQHGRRFPTGQLVEERLALLRVIAEHLHHP